jgi:putative SOS response-associated peptidase YedK
VCSQFQNKLPLHVMGQTFRDTNFPLRFPQGLPNIEPAEQITIGDRAPAVVASGESAELQLLPFGWKGPGGRPVFNFRSDGRRFGGTTRCVMPSTGFFEFTDPQPGEKRKTKWMFTLAGEPWFWLAGIVRDCGFALLTAPPGEDMAPYHDRQVVVLAPDRGQAWLTLGEPEADLLRALPGGSLTVERVFPPL